MTVDQSTLQPPVGTPRHAEVEPIGASFADRSAECKFTRVGQLALSRLHHPAHLLLLEEIADWWHAHQAPFRLLDLSWAADAFMHRLRQCPWPVTATNFTPWRPVRDQASTTQSRDSSSTPLADAEHFPFADASFDVVTCAIGFHRAADQQTMVRELRRILRRNGRLIIVDGFRDNLVGRFVFDLVMKRPAVGAGHASWTATRDYFTRAGFRRIRHRKSGVLLPLLATIGDVE